MDIFKLIRAFWDWAYENPEKIKPNHCAVYFFSIEHCNRLGWKEKFGLPTTMVMEAIGIRSYTTYINSLNDLVDWGFIKLIEKSKNQYSANIVALPYFDKAPDKALDKALIKHASKQVESTSESTSESIVSIDIPIYKETKKQDTNKQTSPSACELSFEIFWNKYDKKNDRKNCFIKWKNLKQGERDKCLEVVDAYVKSKPDIQYRKNPSTWLNGECWNNEIENTKEVIDRKESYQKMLDDAKRRCQ